jgi:hypothetical protein
LKQRVEHKRVELDHGNQANKIDAMTVLRERQGNVDEIAGGFGNRRALLLRKGLKTFSLTRRHANANRDIVGHSASFYAEAGSVIARIGYRLSGGNSRLARCDRHYNDATALQ